MLFLAVFCGFMAENQREHLVEHKREVKYVTSLYEDLKGDTSDFQNDIPFWTGVLNSIDTIRQEIEKPEGQRNHYLLYKSVAYMRAYNNFEYHDRTIEQLKNGGNFRLIRNSLIADSIMNYDAIIKGELRDQELQSNIIYQNINFLQDKFFNSKYYMDFLRKTTVADSLRNTNTDILKVSAGNELLLFQYSNHLQYYYTMTKFRVGNSKVLLRKATNLIKLLKNEYHLDD